MSSVELQCLEILGRFKETGAGPKYVRFFYDLVRQLKPELILELGVMNGISTRAFLLGLKTVGKGHLVSCDRDYPCPPLPPSSLLTTVCEWGLRVFWTFVVVDDLELGRWLWKLPVDILYIDTDHVYEHTVEELKLFYPYVKEDGIILLHETHCSAHPGVDVAISNFLDEHREWQYSDLLSPADLIGHDRGLGCLRRRTE